MLTGNRIRTASALVFSLGIHAGIMNLGSGWLQPVNIPAITPRRVTMTLTARRQHAVVPPTEEITPLQEKQTVQNTENVIVREIPRPIAAPAEPLPVVVRKNIIEKSTPIPVDPPALQEQESLAEPVDGGQIEEKLANEKLTTEITTQEKTAQLPVTTARPLYKKNPKPVYPTIARRRRYQGTTLLEVQVDSRGRVGELRVVQSSGYEVLDRAALTAVRDWLFEPGRRRDVRVDMWVRVPVRFQLQ